MKAIDFKNYIGCECLIFDSTNPNEGTPAIIEGIDIVANKVICERTDFEPEQIKLTSSTIKENFIKILKDSDLWYWFLGEFSILPKSKTDWEANEWYQDGWWFDENSISYRACDLFDDHSEGYNWNFYQDDYHLTMLHHILLSHGFEETHNSGDEEDGFYRMELKEIK